MLSFNFNCYVNTTLNPSFKKRNFFKGDYLSINTSLQKVYLKERGVIRYQRLNKENS